MIADLNSPATVALSLNEQFVANQIRHWLGTYANGYLGSNYGGRGFLESFLHSPMNTFDADAIVRKMREDIPILALVSEDYLSINIVNNGFEEKKILIKVYTTEIEL